MTTKRTQPAPLASIKLPDDLRWEVKAAASKRKITMQQFFEAAIRAELRRSA